MTEQQIALWFATSRGEACPLDGDVATCAETIERALGAYADAENARVAAVADACAALARSIATLADDDAERVAVELRLVREAAELAITTQDASRVDEARADVRVGMRCVLWTVRAGWRCNPGA